MIRFLWILVVFVGCFATLASAEETNYGDPFYLEQQKDLLLVLKYVHQPHWHADLYTYASHYNLTEDYDSYNNVEQVKEFVQLFNGPLRLSRKALFSIYEADHLSQVKALFNVFYNAKKYETLAKVVAWSRFNVNEKMFMYVVGLLISHRKDVSTLIMPPPYEVCPYQFMNLEVIKSAQRLKMQGFDKIEKVDGQRKVVVLMNYTSPSTHLNEEQKLSYFTEDPAYNAFYYNFNLDYPHWMEGKEYGLDKDRRGELYLAIHQQMMARYYLERLSNGLGSIPDFNWRTRVAAGYHPSLFYVNGVRFPTRSNYFNLYQDGNRKHVQEAEDRERRIRDIVDKGFFIHANETFTISKPEDVNTLGNLIQGNPDGSDLHHNAHDHIVPTYLENYATAARDPLFYLFYKKLLKNFWKFTSHVKPYTRDEVSFPGVKISSVQVDRIETFFENFDIDITNAIDVEPELIFNTLENLTEVVLKPDENIITARTVRLNHKPFNFKINIQSDKDQLATVRVFLGPKFDEFGNHIKLEGNRQNFVSLDVFLQSLSVGENVINRKSTDNLFYDPALTSFNEIYKRVMAAKKGEQEWTEGIMKGRCQFPKHLMIPKGTKGGMTYQLYFVVSAFKEASPPAFSNFNPATSCGIGSGTRYVEDRSMLFPIDRVIDPTYFFGSNMHLEDIEVYFIG